MRQALIFDCDGVLADSEQQAHLQAFNQMWRELNIPWQWSKEEYAQQLKISGGKERLNNLYHNTVFRSTVAIPDTVEEWDALVRDWHKRKTEIYKRIIAAGAIKPRPGIRRISEEAISNDWVVAVASSGARESVEAILRHVVGDNLARSFYVLAGDIVKRKKPAPDIYNLAIQVLDVLHCNCIVIEDTRNGLLAARAADMKCIVTPTKFTQKDDFSEASLVLSSLGDPYGEKCQVLQNRSCVLVKDCLRLSDLTALLRCPSC